MGIKKVVKEGIFGAFRVKNWVGYDQIKEGASVIKEMVLILLRIKDKDEKIKESFEQCMKRMNLTEEDLQKRMRTSINISLFYLLIGLAIFSYTIYLIVLGQHVSSALCLVLSIFMFANAFRENFNYFQMKQRRLGCNYKEWLANFCGITFKRGKK